jgi:non-specific serine/threonine protein kinase
MNTAVASIDSTSALPVGHRLHEFELQGVIGIGGFGIVYRAFDHSLQRAVAIKEYMPSTLAGRTSRQQVSLLSQSHAETFAIGLASFVNEARLLARFDHPALLKVHRFWEDNGTAYMAMPLYRGRTLRQWRQALQGAPDEAWLRKLLHHVLGALDVMHREAVYHRDIAPDNILVDDDGSPVLLDFGAARRVISDRSQTLTAILKPSYAPLEQYAESTGMRQGPWTDFYALGATLHFLITGRPPMAATARALHDDQPRLAGTGQGGLSDVLLQVCDWMIAPRPTDRPQNAAEVRAALAAAMPVPRSERERQPVPDTAWQNTVTQAAPDARIDVDAPLPTAPRGRGGIWPIVLAVVVASAATAAAVWWAIDEPESLSGSQVSIGPVPSAAAGPAAAALSASGPAGAPPTTPAPEPTGVVSTMPARADAAVANGPVLITSDTRPPSAGIAAPPARARAPARRIAAAPPAAGVGSGPDTAVPLPPPAAPADIVPPPRMEAGAPRDNCAGRHLIALHRCLVRECDKPVFQNHPQCIKVRAVEERARRAATGN